MLCEEVEEGEDADGRYLNNVVLILKDNRKMTVLLLYLVVQQEPGRLDDCG